MSAYHTGTPVYPWFLVTQVCNTLFDKRGPVPPNSSRDRSRGASGGGRGSWAHPYVPVLWSFDQTLPGTQSMGKEHHLLLTSQQRMQYPEEQPTKQRESRVSDAKNMFKSTLCTFPG